MRASPIRHVGNLLVIIGLCMLLPGLYALLIAEKTAGAFFVAAAVAVAFGFILGAPIASRSVVQKDALHVRDALGVVVAGWFAVAAAGALPFLFAGTFSHWSDALFEAVSGFTTTGATVIIDVGSQPRSLLLWRSLLQWLGGMGIVVLFLSVFPRFGIGGLALFRAEVPGPAPKKALPRLSSTSKLLWLIYVLLTGAALGLLVLVGMEPFDALNHALATVSTGGFSTRSGGPAVFDNPGIRLVLTVFMFLGGMNFLLQYQLFRFGQWQVVIRDGEFKLYSALLSGAAGLIALSLWTQESWPPLTALGGGLFQAVSTMTTTGYAIGDYGQWPPLSQSLLFVLLFIGGSAGSTAGGPKVMRILIAVKHGISQLRQLIHPRSVAVVRVDGQAVSDGLFAGVAAFLILYAAVWLGGVIVLGALGMSPVDAAAASVAALGNIGTAFGATGPARTYAPLSSAIKLFLSLLMIIGRLEVLSILALLHPAFWDGRGRRRDGQT